MWVRSFTISCLAFLATALMSPCPGATDSSVAQAGEDTSLTQNGVGSIAGTVLDARTGRATRWALVSIPDQGRSFDVFCDQNGNFVIRNVPVGLHSVRARMMGWRDQVIDSVSVQADAVAELRFQLMQSGVDFEYLKTGSPETGSLIGRVYSKITGRPLPYVRIKLKETRMRALTDRDGMFGIHDVPADEYTVDVRHYGYQDQAWRYIYVRPDSVTDVEFGMFESDDPTGRIAGTVLNVFTHEPVADASVFMETINFGSWTDSSGIYTIEDIPPGHYTIRAEAGHFEPRTRCGIIVHADSTTDLGFKLFFVPPARGHE